MIFSLPFSSLDAEWLSDTESANANSNSQAQSEFAQTKAGRFSGKSIFTPAKIKDNYVGEMDLIVSSAFFWL